MLLSHPTRYPKWVKILNQDATKLPKLCLSGRAVGKSLLPLQNINATKNKDKKSNNMNAGIDLLYCFHSLMPYWLIFLIKFKLRAIKSQRRPLDDLNRAGWPVSSYYLKVTINAAQQRFPNNHVKVFTMISSPDYGDLGDNRGKKEAIRGIVKLKTSLYPQTVFTDLVASTFHPCMDSLPQFLIWFGILVT